VLTILVSMTARNNTAKTTTRAACGFPAPNSFETPVLNKKEKKLLEICSFNHYKH
jgi:hypothetical protein